MLKLHIYNNLFGGIYKILRYRDSSLGKCIAAAQATRFLAFSGHVREIRFTFASILPVLTFGVGIDVVANTILNVARSRAVFAHVPGGICALPVSGPIGATGAVVDAIYG